MFATQYKAHEVMTEKNDGETMVDIAMYRPTSQRIKDYILSGERLEDMRRLQYHSDYLENMESDNWTDPLLYRGYDKSDIMLLHKEAIEEIEARRRPQAVNELSTAPADEASIKTPEKPEDVGNSLSGVKEGEQPNEV